MDSVIADAQTLADELGQHEPVQNYTEPLSKMAQSIRFELSLVFATDGSLAINPQKSEHYTRAPFAIIASHTYLLKKQHELSKIILNGIQLARLESIDTKVKEVKSHLDKIWNTY